ncbi:MAG: aroD [Ignavibacteria bacterium]|nr:aroD [Ignavibacteria bacterium]
MNIGDEKICISVDATNLEACRIASGKHYFIEYRLDNTFLSIKFLKSLFKNTGISISSCRNSLLSSKEIYDILKMSINAGTNFIDIDLSLDATFRKKLISKSNIKKVKIILSYHNFSNTPTEEFLDSLIESSMDLQFDILKIACMVKDSKDCRRLLSLYNNKLLNHHNKPLIAIGMGEEGKMTRLSNLALGAPFTYCSLQEGLETAPGQLDFETMKTIIANF